MKISELRENVRSVNITGKIVDKSDVREVQSRYGGGTLRVANATLQDDSGTITLTLWNTQIDEVNVGDTVKIENGYTNSFRGEIQLNIGRYGKISVEWFI